MQAGLGPSGIGSTVKGDTLAVCDVNGDGRPDFLYGAGSGVLVINTMMGFVEAKHSGISYKPGKVGPTFGDFGNSGHPGSAHYADQAPLWLEDAYHPLSFDGCEIDHAPFGLGYDLLRQYENVTVTRHDATARQSLAD